MKEWQSDQSLAKRTNNCEEADLQTAVIEETILAGKLGRLYIFLLCDCSASVPSILTFDAHVADHMERHLRFCAR